jgi:hypothetical protein
MTNEAGASCGSPEASIAYTILIRGRLPEAFHTGFPPPEVAHVLDDTLLTGVLADRTQFLALLQELSAAGIAVISASASPRGDADTNNSPPGKSPG